ncbi:MAG: hypothetical protein ACKOGP_08260, partial [Bacteroidota bacterium]
ATATVNPLPIVTAGPDTVLCNQSINYSLTGFGPSGGTWSGSGLSGPSTFNPGSVGTGQYTLVYSYTNANNCSNSDTVVITVVDPTVVNAGTGFSVCLNSPAVTLTGYTPQTGGVWSGTNVSSAGVFTPSVVGTYTLTYTFGSGTCLSTDTIQMTVESLPPAGATGGTVCVGQTATLTATGGGTYLWSTGATTSSINVTPTATTTYTVTVTNAAGCTATATATATVNPLPIVNAGNDTTYCFQGINVQLPTYATPANGTWFGNGVLSTSGLYDPSIPGVGSHYAYYTYTDGNNCTNLDSILVNIVLPSVADAGPGNVVCIDNGTFNLSGFSPAVGGSWSGPGIINASTGLFNPAVSGVGTFLLYYEFGVGSCFTKDSTTVTVNPLPIVNAGNDIDTCISVPPFTLSGFNPASG